MNDVKFIYVRDETNFPVGCFAYTVDEHNEERASLSYAFSIFYMKDKFNKARARTVASGRLDKPVVVGYNPNENTVEGVLVGILNGWAHLSDYQTHPWARNEDGDRRSCGHRFRDACRRTAAHLSLHAHTKANVA